jgi:hypothetical protein
VKRSTIPPVRRQWLAAAVVAAGCSRPAVSPWTDPEDPPLTAPVTLSLFESQGTACLWVQLEPISGSRRVLLHLRDDCDEPSVTWSPDGRQAVVMNATALYQVSLATLRWRPLPAPPGDLQWLFIRDGVLWAWTEVSQPEPLLVRIGLKRPEPAVSDGTHSFRLSADGSDWIPERAEIPDDEQLRLYDSADATYESSDLVPVSPDVAKAADKAYEGPNDWRELGGPAVIEPSSPDGPQSLIYLRHSDGGYALDPFAPNLPVTPMIVSVRDHWAIVDTTPVRLYDGEKGTLLWKSEDNDANVRFWPLHGAKLPLANITHYREYDR